MGEGRARLPLGFRPGSWLVARSLSRHYRAPAEHVRAGAGRLWPSSARRDAAPRSAAARMPGQRRVKEAVSLTLGKSLK